MMFTEERDKMARSRKGRMSSSMKLHCSSRDLAADCMSHGCGAG